MSFSVGIVGLPNVGKSTLFKALTKNKVDIAPYPFTTIHPNVGVVHVPDERLEKVAKVIQPKKTTPTIIEFVDIAGLVKGAHKGEGLGNQFLGHIRNCDAVLEVVRAFDESSNVENVLGEVNPEKEIEIVRTELLMKDLETLENLIQKISRDAKSGDRQALKKLGLLEKIKKVVSGGNLISTLNLAEEEKKEIEEYQFLTEKPVFFILNSNEKTYSLPSEIEFLTMNLKDEEEMSELSPQEEEELGLKSQLDRLILACYNILNLITFYTVAGKEETRAWTLKRGEKAPEAGGVVHSDFEEKFIKAEVINWQSLIEASSWSDARERGQIKTVGRDYLVQDGDVIEFKI